MKDQATRQMRVPPSTMRAENLTPFFLALAHARALLTTLCADLPSSTKRLSPTAILSNVRDAGDALGIGTSASIFIRNHYIHTFHMSMRRSLKSVKSVFSHYQFFSRVLFLDKYLYLNGLVRFNGDRKTLTSLTPLIRRFFDRGLTQ